MNRTTHFHCYLIVLAAIISADSALAGEWGLGKWGQMYWGSNPESAPSVAPAVSAQGDGSDITFTLTNLTTGQEVGYSAIVQFEVTCGDLAPVLISVDNPRLTDLEPDTEYSCSIVAINEPNGETGRSPTGFFTAVTDPLGTIPVWLLYQATQQT